MPPMSDAHNARPRILFATISVGGGHVATARAMAEAVERFYPGRFDVSVSDYVKEVGPVRLDRFHKDAWRWALKRPLVARGGQFLVDRSPRLSVAFQGWLFRHFARAAAEDLRDDPPALVVSNHGLLTTGFAEARRLHGLRVPVLTFATEPQGISAYWADPRADHIVAPSEETRLDLLRFGVPKAKLSVAGYPVRQVFLDAPTKAEARASLGLERDHFTCLVSLGGEGMVGNARQLVRALLAEDDLHRGTPRQVVVLTGRNPALRKELSTLRAPGASRLIVEGFVEDVATRLAASDVFVGKSGPASVYEALAVGRPVLVTGFAAFNELGVARFVERSGLGVRVRTPQGLREAVRRYERDPMLMEAVARRCRTLDLASQTESLAHCVARYALSGGTPPATDDGG